MIRTRDFLLYMLVLGFVLLGATYTGFSQRVTTEVSRLVLPSVAEAPTYVAYVPPPEADIASRWQELRQKLAAGEGYLASAPPDFTSVDQRAVAEQQEATSSEGTFVSERTAQWCTVPIPTAITTTWPKNTRVTLMEGQRVVESQRPETVASGSTTETITVTETVVTLPVRAVRTPFDSCLPDTLIGVTTSGQPLTNDMASLYVALSPTQPVGYTRDGFVIYGPVSDPNVLDACGGRYVNGQYQYHVRVDEPFILGCYAGVPVEL